MSAPQKILELVDRFERNKQAYLSSNYNETQLRGEFINPFFEELSWDVRNVSGKAEAYKDVIHEDAIKIGQTTKAPDYSFRIGGTRKFFLETKKPSVNIKQDVSPAYQIRRYSWSAKLPLAVLTDFEEFAVYDCRQKPLPTDSASVGRILYIRYDEYATRWDEIAGIFSKNSIETGLFDQYIESVKGKKGTSEVDDEFLKEIEDWRDMLARNIAIRNPKLSIREMNYAVQTTIDRIVFLRICEDRGIEPYGQLQELSGKDNVYKELKKIYEAADEKYNSGLFHFKEEKGRSSHPDELSMTLEIDDKILKDIIKRLYYPECPYVFSVLSVDILGNVYEQFLGKVIRLTESHRAVVEEKPEVKKAGGVYYTPKYIVDYIVENTVGKLIKDKTPKEIAELKILDPACGSGSFLIGAYQRLLDYHRDWYFEHKPEKHTNEIYQGRGGQWYLTTQEKKRILLNNIYGVDIDSQAVEVTKLNLMLKVLENESQDTLQTQKKLFRERALPDLDQNIKCGNSLIGPEFYHDKQTTLLGQEEQYRINVFDWNKEFPYKFDAVIGNPPYVLVTEASEKVFLQEYYILSFGKPDLYRYFIERSHQLLRSGSLFGFIVPNTLLTIPASKNLREYLLHEGGLIQIVNFWGRVFKNVSVNSIILLTQKQSQTKLVEIIEDTSDIPNPNTLSEAIKAMRPVEKKSWLSNDQFQFYLSSSKEVDSIINKIRTNSVELDSLAKYTLGMQVYHNSMHTKNQIKERIYHSEKKKDKTFWPESGGRNIHRYFFLKDFREYVSYGEWCYNKPAWGYCSAPRILIREIPSKTLVCTISDDTHVPNKAVIIVIPEKVDIFYLLGILNSSLLGYYVHTTGEKGQQRLFPRISLTTVRKLPIHAVDPNNPSDKALHDKVVSLVSQLLDLHRRLSEVKTPQERLVLERQIETIDNEINQITYKLYGLTEEEIKSVEGFGHG